jgi:hypothetical protein
MRQQLRLGRSADIIAQRLGNAAMQSLTSDLE